MGVLVDVKSSEFELPAKGYDDALAALQAVVEDDPDEVENAEQVLGATTLLEALKAAHWIVKHDAKGIHGLRYGVDKAPHEADDYWPSSIMKALAPSVTKGKV